MPIAYGYIDRNEPLPPNLEKLTKGAAGMLGRLHGAADTTYRSWSPFHQISSSNLDAMITKVRDYVGLKPAKLFG